MITHSAKETGQQKVQWGWHLKVTGKWGEEWVGQNLKKRGVGNRVGLHKIGGLAPLCQVCKETLKSPHPPL